MARVPLGRHVRARRMPWKYRIPISLLTLEIVVLVVLVSYGLSHS